MRALCPFLVVIAAPALLLGCPNDVDSSPDEDDAAEVAVCLQGEPFVADGSVALEPGAAADADRLIGIRWESHDGCERLVIDVGGEDDGPAIAVGDVRATVLRDRGVVRIDLHDVERAAQEATDARPGGDLARAAYAVRSPEGRWVYVDVHLADVAEVHVALLEEPARVVVDLRPGGPPIPASAVIEDRVVVLEPRPGEAGYPLTVTGYARTFEANVVARLSQDGEDMFEDFTTSTGWVDAWGHFEMTIDDGPSGQVILHVGEYSAKDGTWEGAAVELVMP